MRKIFVGLVSSLLILTSALGLANNAAAVNLNSANAQQLVTIKGIGSKRAEAIVAYRHQHGRFKALSDLTAVRGISNKTLQRWQKNNPGRLRLN